VRRSAERGPRVAALAALIAALSHCSSDAPSALGSAGQSAGAGDGAHATGGANSGGEPSSGGVSGIAGSIAGTPCSAGANNASAGTPSSAGANNASAGMPSSAGADNASAGTSSAGTSSGGTSSGGSASGTAGGGGQTSASAFTCNLVLGVSPTGQWFDSGFLSLVAADHWEAIWVAHHYTSFWADPADSAWTQAFDPYPGPAHQCAQGAKTPDRVLFVAVNWTYTTANQWQADLTRIVQNLQAKYPTLRRIELMTLTRAPGNVVCAPGGSSDETIIPAWTDVAIAAMAAKYPMLVVAAPKFEVPHCSDFMGGGTAPQYTDAGAEDVAQLIGTYYAAHP
jgi:hypothetical protein